MRRRVASPTALSVVVIAATAGTAVPVRAWQDPRVTMTINTTTLAPGGLTTDLMPSPRA